MGHFNKENKKKRIEERKAKAMKNKRNHSQTKQNKDDMDIGGLGQ